MHKAVLKTIVGVQFGRNWPKLSQSERSYVSEAADIDRLHIRPAAITESARVDKAIKFNLVSQAHLESRIPLENHVTWRFIRDIVAGKSAMETELAPSIQDGKPIKRKVFGARHESSRRIANEADLATYYRYCIDLIDSIRQHGFLDLGDPNSAVAASLRAAHIEGRGNAVGVGIDCDGNLLHLSKGYHRLSIAQHLGLARMPVAVTYISQRHFRHFASPADLLTERRLIAAIRRAVAPVIDPCLA